MKVKLKNTSKTATVFVKTTEGILTFKPEEEALVEEQVLKGRVLPANITKVIVKDAELKKEVDKVLKNNQTNTTKKETPKNDNDKKDAKDEQGSKDKKDEEASIDEDDLDIDTENSKEGIEDVQLEPKTKEQLEKELEALQESYKNTNSRMIKKETAERIQKIQKEIEALA